MKIIRFEASNVLRIKAVELQPDGSVMYYIGGKNKAGKSSVLTAIEMCLAGASAIPPEPLRKGAKRGKAVLDLGDIIVERRFTPSGTTLIVKNADGTEVKSPQKMLDTLIGRISFDPSEFARMDPKDQLATLQRIVGLDFKPLDEKRARLFQSRTEVNRRAKECEARLKLATHFPDAPTEEVKVVDLMNDMKRRQQVNAHNAALRNAITDAEQAIEEAASDLTDAKEALKRAQERVAECEGALELAEDRKATAVKNSSGLTDEDVAEVEARIKDADEVNRKVRANFARKQEQEVLRNLQKEADKLTEQLEEIDEAKQESLAAAEFPIAGLGFDEKGVTFNGLPFEQCSSAESIEVSMAIGLAVNPKLPVVLIKHGSLIDDEQLEIVRKMAEAHQPPAQVIVERVGEGAECSVIICDGHIKGEEQPEDEPEGEDAEPVAVATGSGEGP